jgi:lipopolysaccharide assembly outer membrane protein LptD (OstA)
VRSRAGSLRLPAAPLAALLLLLVPAAVLAQTDGDSYRLRADRLEGSLTGAENVYTAFRPILTHGTTTVTGDSALVYRTREYVLFRGHVKIVDGTTTMWGDEASYDRKDRLATLRGNVRILERGSIITGREAYFYRDKNLSVITGSPRMVDSTRTLTADRIEYDRNSDVVLALGNVDAMDEADSVRIFAGRIRYDRRADYAWADVSPRMDLTESGGVVTHVNADTLEFDRARDAVIARGKVRVEREKLQATAGRALFFRRDNRALLLESPRAWDPEGSASGDTLEIRFVQNRVASIQARPNAQVAYAALADTGRAERTTASGDTITLFLEDDAARRAVVVGHANSFYWPSSADSARGGRNESKGDTIIVEFDEGKPARATVLGGATGTYYMAAEGDTTGAEKRERILYSGREIAYDLRRNTVDITGSADVGYREMRLKAARVHFDAETEKMRAEGKPVLEDAGDRIVGETMTYDLRIRRGAVAAGRTKYEQGYVTGDRVLRVSESILNVKDGTYTTCDLPDPHYHFGSNKMRILLKDKAVAKPVVFYIKHIPVFAIPFYVFPINTGRHSGFQLPQFQFGASSANGKYVRNVGYYWAISDHLDATGYADYYQDQSWVAHGQLRYHRRYSYYGDFSGSFQNVFGSLRPVRNWDVVGNHYQTLGSNFLLTARANLTNSSEYKSDPLLGRSSLSRVQRNLHSFLALDKSWSSGAANVALDRYQYLDPLPGGLRVQQSSPQARIRLNTRSIGRLARRGVPARLPWLASTSYSYDAQLLTQRSVIVNRYSSLSPQRDSIVDARTGMLHNVRLLDNRTFLGAVRVSPNFNASGIYYSRDDAGAKNRLGAAWNAGVGANTQIFGTMSRSIGPLRALRHVVTPSVSFGYQPRIKNLTFTDTTGLRRPRFIGVSGIGLFSGEQRSVSFGLRNDIHVKWGDPARPKVINNLISLSSIGTYNLLAKRTGARPLSEIQSSLTLRPITRSEFSFSFAHDPYTGTLRSMSASTGFTLQGTSRASADSILEMSDEPGEASVREGNYLAPQGLVSSSLPWNVNLSVSYRGNRGAFDRWVSEATLNGSTGLNLSRGWRFDYGAQYNMRSRTLIAQRFIIKREFHCWEAQFVREISGTNKEYYFKINVKLLPEVYYEQGSRALRGFGGINNLY